MINTSMLRLTLPGVKSRVTRSASPSPTLPLVPAPSPGIRRPTRRQTVPSTSNMESPHLDDTLPPALAMGVPMLKISSKKIKQVIVRIRNGAITWSTKKDNHIHMSQVRDLRLGQPPTDTYSSSRWITVVYVRSTQWKVLHMIALTDDIYELWVKTLKNLVSISTDRLVTDITPADPDLMWIRQLWPGGAKVIDRASAQSMCQQIGLQIPSDAGGHHEGFDMATFHRLVKEAQTRPEMNDIYSKISNGQPLTECRVEDFLLHTQKLQSVKGIFQKYKRGDEWTVDSLADFLLSSDNVQKSPQDMSYPLQHYYISSSHNTYLVGEQWRGESTVEGYIRVLLAGCRCVEMDCQNGDVEPVVYHRKTLTKSVAVRDICRAINQYAFVTSPYPVIISAEIHCTTDQQNRLAAILRDVFGERLVTAPLYSDVADLPSPEQLNGRILFKAKPPKLEPASPRLEAFSPESNSSAESDSGFARLARRLSIQGKTDRPDAFSAQLSDLLVYTAGVKYQGFSKLNEYEPRQQFSVSDRTAARILKENKADWIKHNFTHLSRVYPRATRLASGNYDPVPLWDAGCQLVALNWQTLDDETLCNHALFHGSNGYVLKPPALRSKLVEVPRLYRISLRVISAQRLPLHPDIYVEATINSSTRRTSSKSGISLNPHWDENLIFEIRSTPSRLMLNFIRVTLKNKSLLAQWIRPISFVPSGYHHLPLYDELMSKFVFAKLFVQFTVQQVDHSVVLPPSPPPSASASASAFPL